MELRQLAYLVAVAEEGTFTAAAERVHISQSGVSAQIAKLERELGATLIDREGRQATLTPAGAAAVDHARAALAETAALRQAVDDVRGVVRGRIALGMVTGCTIGAFFDALASFQRAHPAIELVLFEAPSDVLAERVRAGAADLALVGVPGEVGDELESAVILGERIVAAVPEGHRLAKRRTVRVRDLIDERLIGLPRGSGIRSVFDQACAAAGVDAEVQLEASAPSAVADLTARGLGIGVLSESMVANYRGRLNPVYIKDATGLASLALVWKAPETPAVRELLAHCRLALELCGRGSSAITTETQ